MKKIVVACGSGVATSMAVAEKLSAFLDGQGLAGAYRIVRCPMSRVLSECADAAMLMATTPAPIGVTCEYVSAVSFLTGMGQKDAERRVLAIMGAWPIVHKERPDEYGPGERGAIMADTKRESPVELFDMYVAHIGINAEDPADANRIAERFATLMGLEARDTPKSVFSGTLVETMKQNGCGANGHIGFHVNDLDAAGAWFAERGFELNEETRTLNEDGSPRLIYFKEEIGGFAIHLTSDK